MHVYPYFSTKLTKKNIFLQLTCRRDIQGRSFGYEAENYLDGVDNLYKWHAENLDENVDEDYMYI